ncbi:hypothetical protein LOKO_00474 [Halomonas chromatireducens]|uniref:Uncharacterized protein n=1 Tax=Halomonas chromatireducens TaxID=507626 RepID=A0A0X8HBS2_9GAMM|nr:hypothetical protein LOKO_00474 [Halomonas chromatireducens]
MIFLVNNHDNNRSSTGVDNPWSGPLPMETAGYW